MSVNKNFRRMTKGIGAKEEPKPRHLSNKHLVKIKVRKQSLMLRPDEYDFSDSKTFEVNL